MTNDTTIRNLIRDTLAELRTKVNTADVCSGAEAELAYDLANSTDDDDNDTNEIAACGESGCTYAVEWFCERCGHYFCGYHFAWRETAHRLCWPCYEASKGAHS